MLARAVTFVVALLLAGCTHSVTAPNSPISVDTANSSVVSFAGTWTGTATDTSGSLAGSGLGGATAALTWQLSQTGNQVTGTITQTGVTPPVGQPTVTLSGTVTGPQMAFTVILPAGSMPAPNTACFASVNGTMTVSAAGTAMTGTYTGASSCSGAFSSGNISLTRQ